MYFYTLSGVTQLSIYKWFKDIFIIYISIILYITYGIISRQFVRSSFFFLNVYPGLFFFYIRIRESNLQPQWCFSHLNQVADFGYGSYGWVCIYNLSQWANEPSLSLCFSQQTSLPKSLLQSAGCTIFFVAAKKTLFRDHKKIFGKVRFIIMHGRKRAKYAGKWSRHGAKWSDTTGQCIYDAERAYIM